MQEKWWLITQIAFVMVLKLSYDNNENAFMNIIFKLDYVFADYLYKIMLSYIVYWYLLINNS